MKKENELINDIKEQFSSLMNARSLAVSNDKRILEFLLENSNFKAEYKERFFEEQCGALIFKKDDFLNFLDLKLLSASYTSFSNKIGLGTSEKRFLKNNENVVLNFPFKDGVIKGGQSRDDDKSTELFFNNILAKSEIDVLFAPKVLNNFELLGKGNINEVLENKPNLLIKGNNLIALHTLKEYFRHAPQEDKIKLIYIDPPYNTGNDSFNYNDKFNHSTWLTFMKNRLEIARELLRDDGVIFVQCDDNEQAYLKVLMDEIFGKENFVADFIRKTKSTTNDAKTVVNIQHENCLCFAKNKNNINLLGGEKDLSNYKNPDNDPNGAWISDNPSAASGTKEKGYFGVTNPYTGKVDYPPEGRFWLFSKNTIQKHIDEGRICFKKEHKENERGFIYKRYLKDLKTTQKTLDTLCFASNEFMNQVATKEAKNLGFVDYFSYPKPETMAKIIIEHSTNENDLVLDFFAGSGTTLAVAHKMKRRCIGIEQMDYIQNITKERLKKVIEGEQGGISKAVSWSGGGNVVYCELAPLNAYFVEKIQNSRNEAELESIIASMSEKAFIDYRVDIKKVLEDKEFSALSLEDKKATLIDCLDRNMDYIPYADINDSEYKISDEAKKLNKIFYNKGE